MKETWKMAGIITIHVMAIMIICCVIYSQNTYEEKNCNTQPVRSEKVISISTDVPKVTEIPTPTEIIIVTTETEEPDLREILIITEKSESVDILEEFNPTELPEIAEVPDPTELPEIAEVPDPTELPEIAEVPDSTETPVVLGNLESTEILSVESVSQRDVIKQQVLENISSGTYKDLENKKKTWWFRRKNNQIPSGSGEAFDMKEYQGFYLNENVENVDKVIYMTIDCGYGSSHTPLILDILKKHNMKVTFFVTKFFIDANPQYVKRMVEEGHLVGNHSVSHADLTSLSDEEVYNEIIGCEEAFFNVTGKQMDLYFRPPEGAYSKRTMQMTEDLGYKTIFWSLAYGDYDKKNQPGKEYVVEHFKAYHHNGAIPLMHNDSISNLEAMDAVVTLLEEQGYRFGTLNELK